MLGLEKVSWGDFLLYYGSTLLVADVVVSVIMFKTKKKPDLLENKRKQKSLDYDASYDVEEKQIGTADNVQLLGDDTSDAGDFSSSEEGDDTSDAGDSSSSEEEGDDTSINDFLDSTEESGGLSIEEVAKELSDRKGDDEDDLRKSAQNAFRKHDTSVSDANESSESIETTEDKSFDINANSDDDFGNPPDNF